MADLNLILRGRGKRALAEAAIVTVAGLSAFAVAHASIFSTARANPEPIRPTAYRTQPIAAAATPEDDVLIAFEEPVPGHAVVSPFGLRQLPWEGNGRLHEGVDISADAGVPVIAAADGVVVAAGEGGGYGRYVAVRHAEGLTTFYAHLGGIAPGVYPGVALKSGAVLGRIGSTGTSTGPHLHFEIRDAKDRPLNPAMFLGKAFEEAGDLPLDKAKRYSGRVRIAQVSFIPENKRAQIAAKSGSLVVRKTTDAQDIAAAMRNLDGAVKNEKIDGLKSVHIGADGRPRAELSL